MCSSFLLSVKNDGSFLLSLLNKKKNMSDPGSNQTLALGDDLIGISKYEMDRSRILFFKQNNVMLVLASRFRSFLHTGMHEFW